MYSPWVGQTVPGSVHRGSNTQVFPTPSDGKKPLVTPPAWKVSCVQAGSSKHGHLQCLKYFPDETFYEVVFLSCPTFPLGFKLMPANALPFYFPMKALLVNTDSKLKSGQMS